jgi:SAM-dependent methyltransferase
LQIENPVLQPAIKGCVQMITATVPNERPPVVTPPALPRLRCVDCHRPLGRPHLEGVACGGCGRAYPVTNGLLVAQGALTGTNHIAAEFYNSDRWQRFRPWEQLFLRVQGGLPGARMQILRHLGPRPAGSLLEVGIGDGENLALLPRRLRVTGIDIAQRPLAACRQRYPADRVFLALAEAERLPFAERSFDAVLCVGGFNFFSDPARALAEMARVTRPGGRIVVADELPDLYRHGWGHRLGWPGLDSWLMERVWFGPAFTAMVLANRLDVAAVARTALGPHRVHPIWRGLGYCIVGSPP